MTAAELVGGRLVLTSFDGQVTRARPGTGREPLNDRGTGTDVDRRWITRPSRQKLVDKPH